MSKEEIITKVNGFLVDEFEIDAALLNDNAALKKDLGIDSLDFVDIVMSLEYEFDTEFPEEDMTDIKTVGDIVKYIEDKLQ